MRDLIQKYSFTKLGYFKKVNEHYEKLTFHEKLFFGKV